MLTRVRVPAQQTNKIEAEIKIKIKTVKVVRCELSRQYTTHRTTTHHNTSPIHLAEHFVANPALDPSLDFATPIESVGADNLIASVEPLRRRQTESVSPLGPHVSPRVALGADRRM